MTMLMAARQFAIALCVCVYGGGGGGGGVCVCVFDCVQELCRSCFHCQTTGPIRLKFWVVLLTTCGCNLLSHLQKVVLTVTN